MKTFRSVSALILSILMVAEPAVQAVPFSSPLKNNFSISLPSSLGYVSDTYSAKPSLTAKPDVILIQDLHVNRSVQFAISGILKHLKSQGLMSGAIAVEGETGPMDIAKMQTFPDASIRKEAADYLVRQGEMPGAMHFAVTEGAGSLYGIETGSLYKANLEMFRQSYIGRTALSQEIEKIQSVLPRLKRSTATRNNATILEHELKSVSQLINNQVTPDELIGFLGDAALAAQHLKQVLPQKSASKVIDPLSASINFYSLALLRNQELFINALTLRDLEHQKTTLMITGGFHTQALADECKRRGLSYAVITPNVARHDKVDERLYVQGLMGRHLTSEQVQTGRDWAAMAMLAKASPYALGLYLDLVTSIQAVRNLSLRRRIALGAAGVGCTLGVVSCGSPTGPSKQDRHPAAPAISNGQITNIAVGGGGHISSIGDEANPLRPLQNRYYIRVVSTRESANVYYRIGIKTRGNSDPNRGLSSNDPSRLYFSNHVLSGDNEVYDEPGFTASDFSGLSEEDLANGLTMTFYSGAVGPNGAPIIMPDGKQQDAGKFLTVVRVEILGRDPQNPMAENRLKMSIDRLNAAREAKDAQKIAIAEEDVRLAKNHIADLQKELDEEFNANRAAQRARAVAGPNGNPMGTIPASSVYAQATEGRPSNYRTEPPSGPTTRANTPIDEVISRINPSLLDRLFGLFRFRGTPIPTQAPVTATNAKSNETPVVPQATAPEAVTSSTLVKAVRSASILILLAAAMAVTYSAFDATSVLDASVLTAVVSAPAVDTAPSMIQQVFSFVAGWTGYAALLTGGIIGGIFSRSRRSSNERRERRALLSDLRTSLSKGSLLLRLTTQQVGELVSVPKRMYIGYVARRALEENKGRLRNRLATLIAA